MLYWPLLKPTTTGEPLAHRIFWSAVVSLSFVFALGQHRELAWFVRQPRALGMLAGASACLTAAWGVYVYAINSEQVVESSLGLFLIPLATAVVGVVAFAERLSPGQWVSVAGAALATVVLAAGYGRLPWLALAICGLMTCYALLKKRANVPALCGFAVECSLMALPAVGFIGWLDIAGDSTVGHISRGHTALVAASGLITAAPLITHAESINLLPLAAVGFLQYLNPTIQFLIGVLVGHEDVTSLRWVGFCVIWCAIVVFVLDSLFRSSIKAATVSASTRGRPRQVIAGARSSEQVGVPRPGRMSPRVEAGEQHGV